MLNQQTHDPMTDDQLRYHTQAKLTRARMVGVRWPTPREIADWAREAQHDILLIQNVGNQNAFTLCYDRHMELGRALYLKGDPVKEVRNEFIQAASQIEAMFREISAAPNQPVSTLNQLAAEVHALEGLVATLMANDLDAARRLSTTIQGAPEHSEAGDPPLDERGNFMRTLMHYLDGRTLDTQESLRLSSRAYRNRRLSGMDARTYYFTLHTSLHGIVERNANLFNTGLAAHLEFYEWMLRNNGSEIDQPVNFICDTALALANLGLAARLKVWTRHMLLPTALLGPSRSTRH